MSGDGPGKARRVSVRVHRLDPHQQNSPKTSPRVQRLDPHRQFSVRALPSGKRRREIHKEGKVVGPYAVK